jgi:hypothetical protein
MIASALCTLGSTVKCRVQTYQLLQVFVCHKKQDKKTDSGPHRRNSTPLDSSSSKGSAPSASGQPSVYVFSNVIATTECICLLTALLIKVLSIEFGVMLLKPSYSKTIVLVVMHLRVVCAQQPKDV